MKILKDCKPIWVPLLALPCLAFGAVGAVHFAHLPGQIAAATTFNILMAIPAFWGLLKIAGAVRTTVALLALSIFAFGIESLGVATGFPYSGFSYGTNLGPKLFELVPLTLPFCWVPLVLGSRAWASRIVGGTCMWKQFVVAVFLMTAFDLVLDPGAAALGYWTWTQPGSYYGIPEQNFLGWLLSAVIGQLILAGIVPLSKTFPWHTTYTMMWGLFFWGLAAALIGRFALSLWTLVLLFDWFTRHQGEHSEN